MSRTQDLSLLAELVTGGHPSDARLASVADWAFVLDQAARHMILPSVATSLAGRAIPAAVAAELDDARANTTAWNGLLRADLAVAVEALGRASIPLIVLKGGALLLHGLVHDSARHIQDIDLRVAPDDLSRAQRPLEAAGFRAMTFVGPDGGPMRSRDAHYWGPFGTFLELHASSPGAPAKRFRNELEQTVVITTGRARVRVPTREALLSGLSEHVLFHHACAPDYLARHLADTHALLAVGTEVRCIAGRASRSLHALAVRRPAIAAHCLFPQGARRRLHVALSEKALFWARAPQTLLHPTTIPRRLFPHPAFLEQFGQDSTTWGRIVRLTKPFRPL